MQNLVNGLGQRAPYDMWPEAHILGQQLLDGVSVSLQMYFCRSTSAVPSLILCAGSGKQQSTKKRAAEFHLSAQISEDDSASDYAPAKRQRPVPSLAKRRGKGQKGGWQKRK